MSRFAAIFKQCDQEAIKALARDSRSGDLPHGVYSATLANLTVKPFEKDNEVWPKVTLGFKVTGTLKGDIDCTDKMQFKTLFLTPPPAKKKDGSPNPSKESMGVRDFNSFYKDLFGEFPEPDAVMSGDACDEILDRGLESEWIVTVAPQKSNPEYNDVRVKAPRR